MDNGPWITHKNGIPIHLCQVLKLQKILVSNIFYLFLFAVSLGNRASKMVRKKRLNRKIGFQITYYTNCINVIIDSIGISIILRSIFGMYHNRVVFYYLVYSNYGPVVNIFPIQRSTKYACVNILKHKKYCLKLQALCYCGLVCCIRNRSSMNLFKVWSCG